MGRAAEELGLHRSSVYRWLDSDPEFAAAFDAVREDIVDELETSVIDRAQKSDLLAMFVMKRWRPEYKDRITVDVELVDREIEERMKRLGIINGVVVPPGFPVDGPSELKLLEAAKVDDDVTSEELAQDSITLEEEKRGT